MITGNDLFMLMMSLSQISSIEQIIRIYIESINSLFGDLVFRFEDPEHGETSEFEIRTVNRLYGYITAEGDIETLSLQELSLLRNSLSLLAVILENKQYNRSLEETVRDNSLMLEKISETAPVIMYVYDLHNKKLLFHNSSFGDALGYSSEEVQRHKDFLLPRIVHPEDREEFGNHRKMLETLGLSSIVEKTFRLLDSDGNVHWFLLRETPYRKDGDGRTVVITGCAVDITEQKTALEITRRSLREREIMLKEIHHRVKNNLQILSSLITIQLESVEDEKCEVFAEEFRKKVHSMAIIHEQLYDSGDMSSIDLGTIIPLLTSNIISSRFIKNEKISLIQNLESVTIGLDQAIPCALVTNELFTLMLRERKSSDNGCALSVSCSQNGDNTVFLKFETLPAAEDEENVQAAKNGMSMVLVNSLAGQLQGECLRTRTGYVVSFPNLSKE